MTETIIVTAIICITVAFIVFICAAVESAKNKQMIESFNKHQSYLEEDGAWVTREEFEEYEAMMAQKMANLQNKINGGF